jgi:hypothetical protein
MLSEAIIIAAIAGFVVEALGLISLKAVPRKDRPDLKDPLYFLPFIVLPLLGGFLAFVYERSAIQLIPIIAFNVGASAPLIIRTLAQTAPSFVPPADTPPGA